MTPRWESPFEPSLRDAALLAEVLGALQSHLEETPDDAVDDESGPSAEVRQLISAAVAEMHRLAPDNPTVGGVAPVLGSGVVHELLRRKRESRMILLDEPEPTVDERL